MPATIDEYFFTTANAKNAPAVTVSLCLPLRYAPASSWHHQRLLRIDARVRYQ